MQISCKIKSLHQINKDIKRIHIVTDFIKKEPFLYLTKKV